MSKSSVSRTSARITPAQKRKSKQQQRFRQQETQLFIVVILAIVILVVIVGAVLLNSGPKVTANTARYANLPTGMIQTGPASGNNGNYPASFPYLGDPNAPVKIEEIGSFSCPVCMAYHQQVFVNLLDEIKAGRLEFIFLPTTETGDFDAKPGTKAAYCAMQQGKFWPMYDLLYDGQNKYGGDAASGQHIQEYAQQSGVDTGQFYNCYTGTDATQFVSTSNNFANQRGLVGTPSIFLFVNGKQILPSQQSPNETPGSMAGIALADLRNLIESAAKPT
jgi:protein-disulfide isomerase